MPMNWLFIIAVVSSIAIEAASADNSRILVGQKETNSKTISVADFGAKCDGAADDTVAMRAAANAIPPSGAVLQFPRGVCVTHGTIYLKSHTHVRGDQTTLLAASPWRADYRFGYALMENVHYDSTAILDEDISIQAMIFDYGTVAGFVTPAGGKHAIRFDFVLNARVESDIFLLRGAEDAVAGVGVNSMLVRGNSAYEFGNCAYDFWSAPANVHVIGNYAETEKSAQMVNFNPDRGDAKDGGAVARGFKMSDNTLVTTGTKAVPSMIEPLGPNTSVRDVIIAGNRFHNAYLVLRGNVVDAKVRENIFSDVAGPWSVFATYPHWGGTGDAIEFSRNVILNPQTRPPEIGVIRMEADQSAVTDNVVIGSGYKTGKTYHGAFSGEDRGNIFRQ